MLDIITKLRTEKPLIHHITNFVTINDQANITLGIGASPIMANNIKEAAEIAKISKALVLNIGTLNDIDSMISAGISANEKGIPIILDPVGAGVSPYRNECLEKIISNLKLAVIRGNISEIKFIAGMSKGATGVDASNEDLKNINEAADIAKNLSEKLGSTIVITGEIDIVSNGEKTAKIKNGHPRMANITGTGCMATSVIASFCSIEKDYFEASLTAMLCMGICGELAAETSVGNGSFKVKFQDAISNINYELLQKRSSYEL
ncbi:MAG: hydroxyethylthiazole kinase [Defluviitaleaceae bacterium]|nr:hydroxyethylthiazole kinase [Defluviitaleaceae bacterium]